MKKLTITLWLSALMAHGFAQGIINFQNSGQTLVYRGWPYWTDPPTAIGNSASEQTYYFALLISPTSSPNFTFTGLYATNTAATTGGRFGGGNGIPVTGWPGGVTMNYEVLGWDSMAGHDFNPAWVRADGSVNLIPAPFGISAIGTGVAGGLDASTGNSLPPFNLFGGTGITSGFIIGTIPEPTSMALAGLGAAALLIFRRRK